MYYKLVSIFIYETWVLMLLLTVCMYVCMYVCTALYVYVQYVLYCTVCMYVFMYVTVVLQCVGKL